MILPGKPIPFTQFKKAGLSLVITPPKADSKIAKFGSTYFFKYNDGVARFLGPELRTSFGIQESTLDSNKTLQISFELPGSAGEDTVKFREFLDEVKERIDELVIENKTQIFKDGARIEDEKARTRVADFVRISDKGYPPSLRALVETEFDNPETIVHLPDRKSLLVDENKQPIQVGRSTVSSVVGRGARLKPVLDIKHLFVTSQNPSAVHIKWRMSYAKLLDPANGGDEWDMDDDKPTASDPMDVDGASANGGEDEEEDEDED